MINDGLLTRLSSVFGSQNHGSMHLPSTRDFKRQYPSPTRVTRGLFLATLSTIIFIFLYFTSSTTSIRPPHSTLPQLLPSQEQDQDRTPAPPPPQKATLHLLIPASRPDPNLCKTLVSARVLGYPAPTIINWNRTFTDPAFVEGGSHLAKIDGTARFLDALGAERDGDLVLMLDGYDAWVQLRPQTLVERFVSVNARAEGRVRGEMGEVAARGAADVRQEVVFGCQKRCWPWSESDPPCYAVPNSTLPADIFGPATDADVDDEVNPWIKFRPRYLNSGVAVGRVGAMRKLFDQALAQAPEDANFGSDQYIFSHIFGDQEVWREIVRRDAGLAPREGWNETHIEEVRAKAAAREDGNFEFGLGVDYGSEIGLNTVFAEDDTDWVRFEDEEQLRRVQDDRGIGEEKRRLRKVAADIEDTAPPVQRSGETTWKNVSLFTDVWTGISPVVIHHNAHRDGMKSLRETWWPVVWFQENLRGLLDATSPGPKSYVAVESRDGEVPREYWPADEVHGGDRKTYIARDGGSGDWLDYHDICGAYDDELFRDGSGWA